MKKTIITTLLFISVSSLFAQITIPEPEFENQIFFVNNGTEQVDLEEKLFYVKKGASVGLQLTGIGKVKARLVVKGATSPVKIEKAQKLYFVCNYNGSNALNPTKIIECIKFIPRKKTREYLVSAANSLDGQTTSNQFILEKYKGRKYGEQSYLVEFTDLAVGEYGFSLGGEQAGTNMYLFSVVE